VLGVSMEGEDSGKDTLKAREQLKSEAVSAAQKADAAIIVVGRYSKLESEDFDIKSLDLPAGQDDLIQAVAKVNKNAVVVINAGGPVIMTKWISQVPALVDMWYGGQEGGNAIADVLFGEANPSGKLPVSFVKEWKDSPAYGHYPGDNLKVEYAEGIYVGYRYFDKKNIEPLFPFGYGLSYTSFAYKNLTVSAVSTNEVTVAFDVTNTGSRAGADVAEVFVGDQHAPVPRPVKELKGFAKVNLKPGETKNITVRLDQRAFSYYDVKKHTWVVSPGDFNVFVARSAADVELTGKVTVR